MRSIYSRLWTVLVCLGPLLLAVPAHAVDGLILIDQARAMAGNVTPGDAPGFPVTLTRAGSYRLSGNLTVPDADTDAIVISGANVTIDLNGFSILGPNVCTHNFIELSCTSIGTGTGIKGHQTFNTVVMNGIIKGMGDSGISISNSHDIATRVERMTISNNGGVGIVLDHGLVLNNSVGSNRVVGMLVEEGLVQGNTITRNGGIGLLLTPQAGYTHNVVLALDGGITIAGGVSLGQNLCGDAVC